MKKYVLALAGLLLLTGLVRGDVLTPQPPFAYGNTPYDRQSYRACCVVEEETILDEFDDDGLWHNNQVHLGADWLPADGRDILGLLFGCTGTPCIVKEKNVGGGLMEFALAAKAAKYMNTRIVIDADCWSACALFADMARAQVCLGPHARLGFHKWVLMKWTSDGVYYWSEPVSSRDPTESDDVLTLVRANGGFPEKGVNVLPLAAALTIWRPCTADR
jgi:hypothetical protein